MNRLLAALSTVARPGAGHTGWCAGGHHCNLSEHRAQPVIVAVPGRGVIVLTRVQTASGVEHVEIRARVRLAPGEPTARAHLHHILSEFDACLTRVTTAGAARRTP